MFQNKNLNIFLLIFALSFQSLFSVGTRLSKQPSPRQSVQELDSFSTLKVVGPVDLTLIPSTQDKIEVHAPNEILKAFLIRPNGDTLVLKFDESFTVAEEKKNRVEVTLYCTDLKSLIVTGSSRVQTDQIIKRNMFELTANGSGVVNLELDVDRFELDSQGSFDIDAKGSAHTQLVLTKGSVRYDGRDLVTESTEAVIKGSSKIVLHATETLKVHLSGSAQVRYMGDPKLSVNKQGSATLSPL